jgi:two-component system chemotaxis sensor kinase CheA
MDVVRSNIEKIGGTVEMRSEEGKGCTFTIKIPLTLAIVSALIVECAGERFAIPQIGVVELVRVAGGSDNKIERINDATVLRLRNRLLPLIGLDRRLGLREGKEDAASLSEKFIVVAQVGSFNFGIVVDRVFDTEEIVVKPVAPILRDIGIFSGNTILGDGSVIMILDPNGLVEDSSEKAAANLAAHEDQQEARASDLTALLLFRAGGQEPKAVPLALVARLEEIEASQIENVNGRHVVQYRGRLMPLIPIDDAVTLRKEGRQPVLVFADGERSMGLLVDAIVDIVEAELKIELASEKKGTIGSAVVNGRATEVVDVGAFLERAFGDWFGAKKKQSAFGAAKGAKRILLVDDSPFFRNMLTPLLGVAGYDVTPVASAAEALGLREKGREFDLIISDIEMPEMNGFEFAEEVKRGERWRSTPIVALTSHAEPQDMQRGREAGFDDSIAKFDRDALLGALSQTLSIKGAA